MFETYDIMNHGYYFIVVYVLSQYYLVLYNVKKSDIILCLQLPYSLLCTHAEIQLLSWWFISHPGEEVKDQ